MSFFNELYPEKGSGSISAETAQSIQPASAGKMNLTPFHRLAIQREAITKMDAEARL